MEYCLSSPLNINSRLVTVSYSSPYSEKSLKRLNGSLRSRLAFSGLSVQKRCRSTVVAAAASNYGGFVNGSSSFCEFSSLNTPIEPVTPAGRFLSSLLWNERESFHDGVADTLERLVADVDEAYARRELTVGSSEACLHRRIAELKERENKTAVEDVMYMLIFYKFSELKVHLIPRISKCVYNSRLEILPSKDWELESIHSFDVLELIREHLTLVIGWRSDFSVTDSWATTKIKRANLFRIYTSSILFGYFLKSATIRHQLELSLVEPTDNMILNSYKWRTKNMVFGQPHITIPIPTPSPLKKREKLSSYLTGFAPDSLAKCAQPNSKQALNLIMKHSVALFGDVESEEVISTSFSTLKRFVLEAIAFGSFLWDAEEYVNTVYNLEEIN